MFNPKLTEKELFLIFSLRKGYAKHPDVIYSLAGYPWTPDEVDQYINHPAEDDKQRKEAEIEHYIKVCGELKKAPNIKVINNLSQKWDKEIERKTRQAIETNDLQNARYEEFLSQLKVVSL